jgi:hypothetical protein
MPGAALVTAREKNSGARDGWRVVAAFSQRSPTGWWLNSGRGVAITSIALGPQPSSLVPGSFAAFQEPDRGGAELQLARISNSRCAVPIGSWLSDLSQWSGFGNPSVPAPLANPDSLAPGGRAG